MCFSMFCGSRGSKSRLAQATGAEPAGQMKNQRCTPLWPETHVEVKMYKAHHSQTTFESCGVEKVHAVVARSGFRSQIGKSHHSRTTFGSCDVEKVHAVVARSTFGSEHVKITTCSGQLWTPRCCPDVEKVHAIVARSTFPSQKCQKLGF